MKQVFIHKQRTFAENYLYLQLQCLLNNSIIFS